VVVVTVRLDCIRVTAALLAAVGTAALASADDYDIEYGDLIGGITKYARDDDTFAIVYWISEEYWEYIWSESEIMAEDEVKELFELLRPYIVIGVCVMKTSALGKIEFEAEDDVQAVIRLKDSDGKFYEPLAEEEVDPIVKVVVFALETGFGYYLGASGQGTHFYLFRARDEAGREIANARGEGHFSVVVGEMEFVWELPVAAFLPRKICPECGRKLSGAFDFCPYDGAELGRQEAETLREVPE